MTLVMFNTRGEDAVVVTDTLMYSTSGTQYSRTTKAHALPHLDAAVVTQGSHPFASIWLGYANSLDTSDFDEFNVLAGPVLRRVWEEMRQQADSGERPDPTPSIAFTIGYSQSRSEFVASAFASARDFEPIDLTDHLFVIPAPESMKPSPLEYPDPEEMFADHRRRDEWLKAIAGLEDRPPRPQPPANVEEWIRLAETIRADRALTFDNGSTKWLVGGDLVLTQLRVGSVTQRRVHHFDMTGDDYRQMVSGTLHPDGQRGPCTCGSGQPYGLCHMPKPSEPCLCKSGRLSGECCAVPIEVPATPPTPNRSPSADHRAGRNDPCPCGSGTKSKKCCGGLVLAGAGR